MSHSCEFLEWDTNFFERRIARAIPDRLDPDNIKQILRWCRSHEIECLYFLADIEDDNTIHLAEINKFHFVDIRVKFLRQLEEFSKSLAISETKIRLFNPGDIVFLRDIARLSHRQTRFYNDIHFTPHLADKLYETWIEKSCNGYADAVFVADIDGKAVGYVSCHRQDSNSGQIGLVGVHPDRRGKGIGQALITQSLEWFAGQGITNISVVTQGRNIQAQRLYEKCGFLISDVSIWYHRWFSPKKRQNLIDQGTGETDG